MSDVSLVPVGAGALALTHRPKLKDLPALRAAGVTHVVTLLAENEGARALGDAAERAGLAWVWVPFAGAAVPDRARDVELRAALRDVGALIEAGGRVVVHCSAGIHRTGMFGYALLRQIGLDREAARRTLGELRAVTADGVGPDRLAWGDALADDVGQRPSVTNGVMTEK
jgi:protein-tyrosine phosphatase